MSSRMLLAVGIMAVFISRICEAETIVVTSIGGWNAGAEVVGGKWTGQPAGAPNPGKYNNYYAVDADPSYGSYWTINGTGFGTNGLVTIPSSPSLWVVRTVWSPTKLTVFVGSSYNFTATSAVPLTITPVGGGTKPYTVTIPAVGTIRSRGYGQCTWFVADTRHNQNRTLPPTAFATTKAIDVGYQPAQWDVIDFIYPVAHTSIITSPIATTTTKNSDGSQTITYQFTIGEMNVKPPWGETQSSVASSFSVTTDKTGSKKIKSGILSNYSTTKTATAYYR